MSMDQNLFIKSEKKVRTVDDQRGFFKIIIFFRLSKILLISVHNFQPAKMYGKY